MTSRLFCCLILALITSSASHRVAAADTFLANQPDLQPVTGIAMVYVPEESPEHIGINVHIASHSAREERGSDRMLFDGETSWLELRGGVDIASDWRLQGIARYQWINKGVADPFIDTWHKVFGLPEGIRDERPRDALEYQWQENGQSLLDLSEDAHGVGDVLISAHYLGLRKVNGTGLTINLAASLPLGNLARLSGSESVSVGAGLHWRGAVQPGQRFRWSTGVGIVRHGDIDLPGTSQRDVIVSAQASLVYAVNKRFDLGARLQGHNGVFRSELDNISGTTMQLVTGGEWRYSDQSALRITVTEDVLVDRSPDVTFRIGLSHHY